MTEGSEQRPGRSRELVCALHALPININEKHKLKSVLASVSLFETQNEASGESLKYCGIWLHKSGLPEAAVCRALE